MGLQALPEAMHRMQTFLIKSVTVMPFVIEKCEPGQTASSSLGQATPVVFYIHALSRDHSKSEVGVVIAFQVEQLIIAVNAMCLVVDDQLESKIWMDLN